MEPEEIWEASFARIQLEEMKGVDFFQTFYVKFFAIHPEISKRFADSDMRNQALALSGSFTLLRQLYSDRLASSQLEVIARNHGPSSLKIPGWMYDLWLDALVQTVAETDPKYEDCVGDAWREVFLPGVAYMKGFAPKSP